MKRKQFFILFLFLILSCLFVFSQKRADLESKKKEKLKQIENVEKLIQQTKTNKSSTIEKINLINRKISLRNEIIADLSTELELIEARISLLSNDILNKSSELESLKSEYARILNSSYYRFRNYNSVMFIMAANSFNNAYRRFYYLKQYTVHRKNVLQNIQNQISVLESSITEYKVEKNAKLNVLNERERENKLLEQDRIDQTNLKEEYAGKEAKLKKELNELQEATRKIEREIEKIIREEVENALKKTKVVKDSELKLSKDFDQNKGRLPWPVANGTVVSNFGEHEHPIYKGIIIKNNGIDISTSCNSSVTCIFDGVVSKVFAIKGANYAIIIRHGNFLTVYQNITAVNVKAGDRIKAYQQIGRSFCVGEENFSTVHFELWRDLNKLNPREWLNR